MLGLVYLVRIQYLEYIIFWLYVMYVAFYSMSSMLCGRLDSKCAGASIKATCDINTSIPKNYICIRVFIFSMATSDEIR